MQHMCATSVFQSIHVSLYSHLVSRSRLGLAHDTMAKLPAPTHRHRSKSAVRGRSPDPKAIKRAAKEAKKAAAAKAPSNPYETPPPKPRVQSPGTSGPKGVARKVSFTDKDSVHDIKAENEGPNKDMKLKDADKIFAAIKDPQNVWDERVYVCVCDCFGIINSRKHSLGFKKQSHRSHVRTRKPTAQSLLKKTAHQTVRRNRWRPGNNGGPSIQYLANITKHLDLTQIKLGVSPEE